MDRDDFLSFRKEVRGHAVPTAASLGERVEEPLASVRRRAGLCIDDVARRMGRGREVVEQIESGNLSSNTSLVLAYLDALSVKRGLTV